MKDACAVSGLAMVGYGMWLVTPALALCVVGGILLAAGVAGHLMSRKATTRDS